MRSAGGGEQEQGKEGQIQGENRGTRVEGNARALRLLDVFREL